MLESQCVPRNDTIHSVHMQERVHEIFLDATTGCVLEKKAFGKISPISQNTPMLESLSNKIARLQACNFIRKRLQNSWYPVNIGKFLRTLFLRTSTNECFCIPEIQTTDNVIYALDEKFIFNYRIYKIFSYLLSFGNFISTEFMFAFVFFLLTKLFQCFVLW